MDLSAVRANARAVRRFTGKPLIACVKSRAYGHGMAEVARALEGEAAGFAVFAAAEGVELRSSGVRAPVIVLEPGNPRVFELARRCDLLPTLADAGMLTLAPRSGAFLRAQLKFDTGMGRLGLPAGSAAGVARVLRRAGVRFVAGTYTHLSTPSDRRFTEAQLDRFDSCLDALRAQGIHPGLVHAANSWGLLASPRARRYGAVRPGLLLYGCAPVPRVPFVLRPAMRFATRVASVRTVEPGWPVTYGHTWRAPRRATLATLPAGYSRGVNRLLSNRGFALLRGRRAPIRGRVTMDLTVVDVTNIPGVRVGDEAVFFGPQGRSRIAVEEVAGLAGSISYETLCVVGGLNERVYQGRP